MTTPTESSKSAETRVVISGNNVDLQGYGDSVTALEALEILSDARRVLTAMINHLSAPQPGAVGLQGQEINIRKEQ